MNPIALIASLVGVVWLYKKSKEKETPAKTTDTTTDTKTDATTSTVVNPNLVADPSVELLSNEYGFGKKTVTLEKDKTYTLSANGFITSTAAAAKQFLIVYIILPDGSWEKTVAISSTSPETKSVTFQAPVSGTYNILSYPINISIPWDDWTAIVHAGGTEKVYISWYKVEEGNSFTGLN